MARTIPEGWTQIPGCLPQEDLWGWTVSGRGYLDMLGGPTATSSCYPPDYQPTTAVIYATDACPNAFTPACSTETKGNWWSVCCPTAHQFNCHDSAELDTATMFCRSPFGSDGSSSWIALTYTMFGGDLQSSDIYTASLNPMDQSTLSTLVVTTSGPFVVTDMRGPGAALWAMAVLITSTSSSIPGDPTATVDSSNSNTGASASNKSQVTSNPATSTAIPATAALPSAGLSTGAVVGIVLGAVAATLLVVLGGWLLYRRGVARGRVSGEMGQHNKRTEEPVRQSSITAAAAAVATEWSSHYHQQEHPYHGYHDGAHRRPHELEMTPPRPRELE